MCHWVGVSYDYVSHQLSSYVYVSLLRCDFRLGVTDWHILLVGPALTCGTRPNTDLIHAGSNHAHVLTCGSRPQEKWLVGPAPWHAGDTGGLTCGTRTVPHPPTWGPASAMENISQNNAVEGTRTHYHAVPGIALYWWDEGVMMLVSRSNPIYSELHTETGLGRMAS